MADGSQRYVAIAKESIEKTAPTGEYLALRSTGGSGISNERTSITSDEIRSDRQIIEFRLGNNQPDITVPFEFSYENFDMVLAGALANSWGADYEVSETVSFADTLNTITLDDGSNWETKGLAIGDYITVRGSVSNDGVYVVKSFSDVGGTSDVLYVFQADGITDASFTLEASVAVNVEGGIYGGSVDTTTNTLTVDATAKTITAGTAVWGDLMVGDAVYFSGFTNAGNNGYKVITTATDTVLTFEDATLVDETATTVDVDYVAHVSLLTTGLDMPTYTVEEGFTDIDEYHYTAGAKVNTMSMSIQPDSIITGDVSFQGQLYSEFAATPVSSSINNTNTNAVFDSYTGYLYFGSDLQCVITGIDFTVDNGLNRRYALMSKDACSIGEGRSNITGTVNAYFPDASLAGKYNQEELFDARIQITDLDKNSYTFGWPRLKFTSDSRDISENDVTESFGFQALGGDTELTNMFIRKQPNIPA